ncbi:UNVERIFIED_CONTAM: hypothetical protein Sangu_0230700 [Sesamum angustifolium]|uniref:Uncharacterized protein n=1 Tax=Sesamum angustifolium TaxID=2727405 RepID=A0AAW2RNI1_9LAMI
MSNQKLQSDPMVGLRYRGGSSALPSVSRFRSGHMPIGMTVGRVTDNLSESDMDTCSDSEGECYGARYSLEASPQDDKIPNGNAKHSAFMSARNGNASGFGNYLERQGARGGGYAAAHRGFVNDESSDSVSSSEVSSTPPRSNNGNVLEKKFKLGPNFSAINVQSSTETVKQDFRNAPLQNKFDDDFPSAPPLGSFQHSSQVSQKLPTSRADASPSLATSGGSATEENLLCISNKSGATEVNNPEAPVRTAAVSSNSVPARYPTFHARTGYFAVRKVKMGLEPPTGCAFASIKSSSMVKLESLQLRLSNVKSIVCSERKALRRERVTPVITVNGSLFHQRMAYVIVGTRRYLKEVPELIKIGFNAWRSSSSSYEVVQESYSCLLRLKSSPEEDAVRMQPGSGETRVFLPDGLGDDLVIEVLDSKGKYCGNAVLQVADITDEMGEKLRSCFLYHEPEHEQVGKVQLYINYSTTPDENSHKGLRYSFTFRTVETIAYDCVLETAMKVQQFQQRNLLLHGPWRWLVTEFASYFGVSDAYTKLRYLSYVMDVATPTADCLDLVHDLLLPVVIKGKTRHTLSHQEVRILGEVSEEIEQILTLVFENYKSLDESVPSGIVDVFGPATGVPAPALAPALKLYKLLHDILSPELISSINWEILCAECYEKRSRRHLSETDEFVSNNNENILMDPVALSTAYKKMKSLCLNVRNEILTDIEIHKQDLLPSFIDLPNLSSSIYSTELFSRLRAFLVSCPPSGPTPPVVELVMATADFQRDLALWNISPIKGGVDAKELFHVYITLWIQDKRLALLDFCKLDKVKSSSFPTQHATTSFIDDIYDRLKETLAEYDVIISRWPEYTFTLENAIADVEKAVVESLERQYAEVLSPLKENTMPMKFGLKYVQKFAKGNVCPYSVSTELGVLLNSMKRMLDALRPQIEAQLKLAYVQAVIDKLVENDMLKFLEDRKENRSWYKASRVAVTVLDDTFASQMQQLLGNALQEKDVEPPRCILEVRSMLCKDGMNHKENKLLLLGDFRRPVKRKLNYCK